MSGLDGEWGGEAEATVIAIHIQVSTAALNDLDEDNRQALEDMVAGQAARKALDALRGEGG